MAWNSNGPVAWMVVCTSMRERGWHVVSGHSVMRAWMRRMRSTLPCPRRNIRRPFGRWGPWRTGARLPEWGLAMLGAADERARSDALAANWPGNRANLCGRLTVRESAAALTRARIYLGHDSGPMHLAAAVGTPCVAVFSSRNLPGEWFPYGDRHRVLYHSISCQGCRLEVCVERQKACIRSITVDQVARSV